MNKKYIIIAILAALAVLGIAEFSAHNTNKVTSVSPEAPAIVQAPSTTQTPPTDSDSNDAPAAEQSSLTSTMQSTGKLLSQSSDYGMAHLIFPTIDAAGQKAITGFDLQTKVLSNGTTQVSLIAKAHDDETQTFIVAKGEKVYFIEKGSGDDSPNQDHVYSDDYAVVVNAAGYILK